MKGRRSTTGLILKAHRGCSRLPLRAASLHDHRVRLKLAVAARHQRSNLHRQAVISCSGSGLVEVVRGQYNKAFEPDNVLI